MSAGCSDTELQGQEEQSVEAAAAGSLPTSGGALSAAGGADLDDSCPSDLEESEQYGSNRNRVSLSRSRSVSPAMMSPAAT